MDYNAGKKSYIVNKLLMSGKKMISPKVWGKKFSHTNTKPTIPPPVKVKCSTPDQIFLHRLVTNFYRYGDPP